MAKFEKVTGIATGTALAVLGLGLLVGTADRSGQCARGETAAVAWGGGDFGTAPCFDPRPISRLVPVAGDLTVAASSDGRGVLVDLAGGMGHGRGGGMATPSQHAATMAGSEIAPERPTEIDSRQAMPAMGSPSRPLFEFPSLIPQVRANRADIPVFDDGLSANMVSPDPGRAWADGALAGAAIGRALSDGADSVTGNPANRGNAAGIEFADTAEYEMSPTTAGSLDRAGASTGGLRGSDGNRSLFAGNDTTSAPRQGSSPGDRFSRHRIQGTQSAESNAAITSDPTAGTATAARIAGRNGPTQQGGRSQAAASVDLAAAPELDPAPSGELADAEPPVQLSDLGVVSLRGGEHDGFSRLVFDFPQTVDFDLEDEAGKIRLMFPVRAEIEPDGPARNGLSRVGDINVRQTPDGVELTFDKRSTGNVRTFRLDNRLVLDIAAS